MTDGAAGAERAPDLVVGVGARPGVPAAEVTALIADVLAAAGLSPAAVCALATVDTRAGEPGLRAAATLLGVELRAFPAEVLAAVPVPHPSEAVRAATGTPAVAEAAALAAAGPGATLAVPKRKAAPPDGGASRATCAVARRTVTPPARSQTYVRTHEETTP
ncbi:cobalamin biosynthesis protein [Streptomyces sp. NPDC047117]|uniref:cobalamin biosynthesis protein n=1 Tax=Streptomyces sp. NPDC047117 TaxID=3155379 RepID=UPI0033F9FF98